MSSGSNSPAQWEQRIARARALALEHPPAREALTFYAGLADYQRTLFLGGSGRGSAIAFIDAIDLDSAAAAVPGFLAWLERSAPAPLVSAARAIRHEGSDWLGLMRERLDGGTGGGGEAFIADAVLQPYAEAAARARHEGIVRDRLTPKCPICAGLPCVAILREEGHGARRTLQCVCCLTEWEYLRVVCPSCGEKQFDALPVYTADAWPHVRIDACDTCKTYVKTVDLTKNGLAVPLVDDMASVGSVSVCRSAHFPIEPPLNPR